MKEHLFASAVILFGMIGGCGKRETLQHQDNVPVLDSARETELVAGKKKLGAELDQIASRTIELETETQAMKHHVAEWTEKLKFAEAERARMLEEGYYLKRRWEKELEGFVEAPSRPVSELYKEVVRKMEQLLQENAELRQKLQESGK